MEITWKLSSGLWFSGQDDVWVRHTSRGLNSASDKAWFLSWGELGVGAYTPRSLTYAPIGLRQKPTWDFFDVRKLPGNAMFGIYGAFDWSTIQSVSGYKHTCSIFLVYSSILGFVSGLYSLSLLRPD